MKFKVVLKEIEETICAPYHMAPRDEFVKAYNVRATIYSPNNENEIICERYFEDLLEEEFNRLKNGEIEMLHTPISSNYLVLI